MSFLKSIFSPEKKEQLDKGLSASKKSFFSKLGKAIAGKSKIDADLLDELEEVLIRSDVGVATTLKIIDALEVRVAKDKYLGTSELGQILREEITTLLKQHQEDEIEGFDAPLPNHPQVIMVVGVNGVGKTTTIGKLAYQYKVAGKRLCWVQLILLGPVLLISCRFGQIAWVWKLLSKKWVVILPLLLLIQSSRQ